MIVDVLLNNIKFIEQMDLCLHSEKYRSLTATEENGSASICVCVCCLFYHKQNGIIVKSNVKMYSEPYLNGLCWPSGFFNLYTEEDFFHLYTEDALHYLYMHAFVNIFILQQNRMFQICIIVFV